MIFGNICVMFRERALSNEEKRLQGVYSATENGLLR
jgi:hypothetical protein